ncbi:DUF6263 family protein [Chryseobacterium hagamense]|uniref:Lipoprotein n=1 Tax=Chryseobacterium hagamense TaxID=395935 RepID=A0A511YHF6_9FLAO|nr:DUF6263 family protein [Chryseobacterium hagamense]GEN74631.1 hypothetical protein CHA01nite_03710 [Chryseobacterium hagamense]
MKNISILTAACLMAVACQKKELQKENLSLNLPKGFEQTLIYSSSTEGNNNGGMNEATEVKFRVDSVDKSSNYYITGEIMRMTFNQKMFGEEIHFDSREASGTSDEMTEDIKPMINNPFTFKIDKFGNILEKQKFIGEGLDGSDVSQYNIIPFAFPRESVEQGFTWRVDTSNPMTKAIMPVASNFTYKGRKNNKVEFAVNSTMKGMEGMMKDTDITGTYVFDAKTKALLSAERTMPVQIGGGTATFTITPKINGF